MATPAARKARPSRTAAASAPSSVSSSRPFLRFFHSPALRRKSLSVLGALEKAEDARAHREDLADLVVELTESGMDAYFMQPLVASGAGFLVQQSARLGLAGATQVLGSAIRGIIGRMDAPQLLSVSGSVRRFML